MRSAPHMCAERSVAVDDASCYGTFVATPGVCFGRVQRSAVLDTIKENLQKIVEKQAEEIKTLKEVHKKNQAVLDHNKGELAAAKKQGGEKATPQEKRQTATKSEA